MSEIIHDPSQLLQGKSTISMSSSRRHTSDTMDGLSPSPFNTTATTTTTIDGPPQIEIEEVTYVVKILPHLSKDKIQVSNFITRVSPSLKRRCSKGMGSMMYTGFHTVRDRYAQL